jgi:hypothetical protein
MCTLKVRCTNYTSLYTYNYIYNKISCPLSDRVGRGGGEVAVVQELKMRVKSEQEEGERLRTQNETLQEEVERLKTELRSEGRGTPTTPHFLRPGSPSGEDQKVRMLTVIALVSIGVALASWLA